MYVESRISTPQLSAPSYSILHIFCSLQASTAFLRDKLKFTCSTISRFMECGDERKREKFKFAAKFRKGSPPLKAAINMLGGERPGTFQGA